MEKEIPQKTPGFTRLSQKVQKNRVNRPNFGQMQAPEAPDISVHPSPLAANASLSGQRKVGGVKRGQETIRFRSFSPIFTIYLTNCVLPISRDTNLTPKCSHSLQQFRCVLLLRTENVNVCVVCCRNIRMAKPLADYADRYARFQCPRSKGMSQLM